MTTLTDFLVVDGVDFPMAEYFMKLFGSVLRAEFKNIETITGTKQLVDNDCQFQLITASGGNQIVELAPEAITNHVTILYNNGGSNNIAVKDDSGVTTFTSLTPGTWCVCYPIGGVHWRVMASSAFAAATATTSGIVELATSAEVTTGTDTTRAVTPEALAQSTYGIRYIFLPIGNPNTVPTTGDGKAFVLIPATFAGYNIISVEGCVTTPSSSGAPTMALRRLRSGTAVDVLSTNVTIDVSEYTTGSAATPPVINTSNDDLAAGDILFGDLDTVGTDAKGHGLLVGLRKP